MSDYTDPKTEERVRDCIAYAMLSTVAQLNYLLKRHIETAGGRNEFAKLMEKE